PGHDMARNQQFPYGNPRDAAPGVECIEDHLPEELLPAPRGDCRLSNRRPDRRPPRRISRDFHANTFNKIDVVTVVGVKHATESLLGLRAHCRSVRVKLIPHDLVELTRTSET